jgi:dienelactone hydrolase
MRGELLLVTKTFEIVIFHSALGLRPGLLGWAEQLRASGFTVHTPDLYDGEYFQDASGAIAKIQELGFDWILARSLAAVSALPNDLIYMGFSNGGACAELAAATRPGARAAILVGAPLPIRDLGWKLWPRIPIQIHFGDQDRLRRQQVIDALAQRVNESGATVEQHDYPGAAHHFADCDHADFNPEASALLLRRVQEFCSSPLAGLS